MDSNEETFETWNKVAKIYEEKFMDMDLYNDTYDFFCESLAQTPAKVLELGCGPGNIAHYLLKKQPDLCFFGTDVAPKMVELAQKNNPSATFAVMDSREIHQIQEIFHGILAGFVLPYFSPKEVPQLISNCHNLLETNGILYLSFVEGSQEESGFKSSGMGRVYFNYHSLEDLSSELEKYNFSILKIFHIHFKRSDTETEVHTVLVAIRN